MPDVEMDLLVLLLIQKLQKKKRKQKRRWSVRPVNRSRDKLGFFNVMFLNIKNNDSEQFFKYTRMTVESFEYLLSLIESDLRKLSRKAISPEMRLAVTLLYLSQGNSVQSISWSYHLGKSTTRQIIMETCEIIHKNLSPLYMPQVSADAWTKIEAGFADHWNMPNCVGAIDGKHIAIVCPENSGSTYFNYKKYHSIVLMAACDAQCKFTLIDVGAHGSQSDGGVFRNSGFEEQIINNTLNLPRKKCLPNTTVYFPHYFVGDSAFPLMENLMRPYPGGDKLTDEERIFNYRLSRARRTIENAFGILAARWRILLTTMHLLPRNAISVVLATTCLHNYLMDSNSSSSFQYCPPNYADSSLIDGHVIQGQWREEITPLKSVRRTGSNRSKTAAYNYRDIMKNYVNNIGSVSWQRNIFK